MVTSTDAASAASGMPVAVPPTPDYLTLSSIRSGMRAARITMDTTRFEQVLNALGITDIAVPPELNGRAVTIQVPPMVEINAERAAIRRRRRTGESRVRSGAAAGHRDAGRL